MKTALTLARVEKDVENAYREAIRKGRPEAAITSPHGTDGYATWGDGTPPSVRLLLEAKFDLDFKARVPVCNTLGQCLLYLKRFEASGEPVPNVILVGDRNECFVLSTVAIKGFLDLPLDWTVAPSKGSPDLTRALVEGMNILPYVYDVDGSFKFRDVLDKIEALAEGEQHAVKASLTNIGAIFTYWKNRVFGASGQLTAVEQVDVFLKCLFHPTDVYLHPTKLGLLLVPGYPDGVPVSAEQYHSFFAHFEQGYKPSEIEAFYANKDRLVEDDARRRQGAFFTPDLWVAEAHKTLDGVLGSLWRDECIVWDPAAGTGNLTRDYTFSDLIISTAEAPDVAVIKDQGYNPGAAVFQYDFLNPDGGLSAFFEDGKANEIPDAVVARLKAAAKAGKRLVVLMNPPYGEHSIAGTRADSRSGMAKTGINEAMLKAKMGLPSRQLYAQFMYQASTLAMQYGFTQHTVALFSKPTFMSSGSYRSLRQWWYGRYEFKSAFMFQASHFADVSGRWGISFTVWNSPGKTDLAGRIECRLLDVPQGKFHVEDIGMKALYNSDDREASKWVREPLGKLKGVDAPQMTSGLKVKDGPDKTLTIGALGNLNNHSNNLMKSGTDVYWTSSCSTGNAGLSVTPANWRRAIALYGARKLVPGDWINDKDEYLAPVEGTPAYEQWVDDCHVYAILHGGNNCTAMRNVPYKGTSWQIHNHFFWKPHASTLAALDTKATGNLYRDCKTHPSKDVFGNPVESSPDPYMASVLPNLDLSPEAKAVLAKLDALWIKSLPMRDSYAAGKPELHLLAWDAGVYQLKHLWRDLFPTEWTDLQASFKALADKLQPGVYDHGFLVA